MTVSPTGGSGSRGRRRQQLQVPVALLGWVIANAWKAGSRQTSVDSGFVRSTNVDDFVMVGPSTFNTDQQFSTTSVQLIQSKAIKIYEFQ